jgi:hypothetical protein
MENNKEKFLHINLDNIDDLINDLRRYEANEEISYEVGVVVDAIKAEVEDMRGSLDSGNIKN